MSGIPLFGSPQDFTHLLVPKSGFDGMHDLQFKAPLEPGEVFFRGALVSINAAGNVIAGLGAVDAGAMPLWAINASNDLDVTSDAGNISGGVVAMYPATGGYELVTTEFESTGTYVPNTPLVPDVATPGFVVDGTIPIVAAESVVGVVSLGVTTEVYGQSALQFWPVYLPARA